MHRVAHGRKIFAALLRGHPGLSDEIDVRLRAAVTDRRLVCVHFHDSVIHSHRPKRREHVFDRVHAHRAFANRGSAFDRLQIFDSCIDSRLILQIFASKLNSVVHGGGMKFERDFFASVKRGAGKSGNFAKRMLKFRRSHRALK